MNPGSHYQEALKTYEESLLLAKEQGNQGGMAMALHYKGTLLLHHGDCEQAGKSFEESLEVCRTLADKVGMRANLRQLAETYYSLGNYTKALKYGNEALTIANALGDKSGVALVDSELGRVYAGAAHYSKALAHYRKSLKQTTAIGNHARSVDTLCQMADVCFRQGKYGPAIHHYQTSLSEGAVLADPGSLANIEEGIFKCATAYRDKGRVKRELKQRQKDKKAAERAGNKQAAAVALCDVAALHTSAGRLSAARACLRDAARMVEGNIDHQSLALLRREEGRLAHENDDYDEAVRRLDESAELARAAGTLGLAGLARALVALGLAHQYRRAFSLALETYAQATATARECSDRRLEALGNFHQAQLNAALGLYKEALPLAQASLAGAEELQDKTLTAISARLLGKVHEGLDDHSQAAAAYDRAAAAAEGGLSLIERAWAILTRERSPLKSLLESDLQRVRAPAATPPEEEGAKGVGPVAPLEETPDNDEAAAEVDADDEEPKQAKRQQR